MWQSKGLDSRVLGKEGLGAGFLGPGNGGREWLGYLFNVTQLECARARVELRLLDPRAQM